MKEKGEVGNSYFKIQLLLFLQKKKRKKNIHSDPISTNNNPPQNNQEQQKPTRAVSYTEEMVFSSKVLGYWAVWMIIS